MLLSNPDDDPESKDQDIDFTSLPLNEALQVSHWINWYWFEYDVQCWVSNETQTVVYVNKFNTRDKWKTDCFNCLLQTFN